MATARTAARGSARAKAGDRKPVGGQPSARNIQSILNRRAQGLTPKAIALEANLRAEVVRSVIAKAREDGDLRALTERCIQSVLDRRALGLAPKQIALEVRLRAEVVRSIIAKARHDGDLRALTERQAADVAAERAAARAQSAALADAIAAATETVDCAVEAAARLAPPPEALTEIEADIDRDKREAFVARLRDMGAHYRVRAPAAASGLLHLSDLHEHHVRFYPSLPIASEGATEASTRRMFPPVALDAAASSPARACAES